LVGVLSVYSTQLGAFTEDHRRILEVTARQISKVVKVAVDAQATREVSAMDDLTGLPHARQLESFVAAEIEAQTAADHFSIVLASLEARCFHDPSAQSRFSPEEVLPLVSSIRAALRGADVLTKLSGYEFVVLLAQTDFQAAELVASRIAARVGETRVAASGSALCLAIATAPRDGSSLHMLIESARARLGSANNSQSSIH
jgi:diguanylate cyclase (GGDEF)-like protein